MTETTKPLRIGVITFHYAVNYGALMQAYGLVEYLRRGGHDVEVIDYRSPSAKRYVLRAVTGSRWNAPAMFRDYQKYRLFMRFLRNRLKLTPQTFHKATELDAISDRFDMVVTGSDQVWNTKTFGYETPYFLNFANPQRTRLVSYAPSAGVTQDWGEQGDEIRGMLDRFEHLSARDDSTAELVEGNLGRRPTMVLDPTFIGDFAGLIDDQPATSDPYLLVYHVQKSALVDRWVDLIKRKLGLRAIVVGAPSDAADEKHVVVSPERWLGYVKNAEMVVTNSFHGTIFSMLYRRPMAVVPHRSGSMRLVDLLARAGVPERFLPDEADESALPADLTTPDYDAIHSRFSEPIAASRRFLDEALASAAGS